MKIPDLPNILEINTAVFLHRIGWQNECPPTLAHVPDAEWDKIAEYGFQAVWLMGVWERSPLGRDLASTNADYQVFIENPTTDDIIGSAYSIARYEVSASFGGREELAAVRSKLAERGIGLILDYIPNHVGLDHHWVQEHPEYFIQGNPEDIEKRPDSFYQTETVIIARGKDPNFPAWTDVAQLNAFSTELRVASIATLQDIAMQCDGVRCDMAMLLMNDIFARTWGKRVGEPPKQDYWPTLIAGVRKEYPDFCFIAEVYWDKEAELLEQGFSYCYDKKLYDLLMKIQTAKAIDYLKRKADIQGSLLRFISNHDENAPAGLLTLEQEQAAAVALSILPSGRMFFDNQLIGYPEHIPVQLRRGPVYEHDGARENFYEQLLRFMRTHSPDGTSNWQYEHVAGKGHQSIFCWSWQREGYRFTAFINYSSVAQEIEHKLPDNAHEVVFGQGSAIANGLMQPWQYVILKSDA